MVAQWTVLMLKKTYFRHNAVYQSLTCDFPHQDKTLTTPKRKWRHTISHYILTPLKQGPSLSQTKYKRLLQSTEWPEGAIRKNNLKKHCINTKPACLYATLCWYTYSWRLGFFFCNSFTYAEPQDLRFTRGAENTTKNDVNKCATVLATLLKNTNH